MLDRNCPSCGTPSSTPTISRRNAISMQNYIYRERGAAENAPVGEFELYFCQNCGLAFNAAYDASLMNYDEGYSAYIPSAAFADYYRQTAVFLDEKFSLDGGLVIDIACGKGEFLKTLTGLFPTLRGLGIDPGYEFENAGKSSEKLKFIKDVFREEYICEKPALITCRHAFDQIENPLEFLKSVRRATKFFDEVPFFIEVGDLEWIIENQSFADFCYERCSFFTAESLTNILHIAGLTVEKVVKSFGGQYLSAYGKICRDKESGEKLLTAQTGSVGKKLVEYAAAETKLIAGAKAKLLDLKAENYRIAVWGMATKGVIFCNLIDGQRILIDYCVDLNPQKNGCFVPHTGHQITEPKNINTDKSEKIAVVVMNGNYLHEIAGHCRRLNLDALFLETGGGEINKL